MHCYVGAAETLISLGGFDRHVKKFIPQNSILRDVSVKISTQFSESSGMLEPMAQLESRVTESLKMRLSQPVITGRGRRAQAEYQFNRHLSAQAQWDSDSREYSTGDLGLDLKLHWNLD